MLSDTYELANGVQIPKIGYGTWMIEEKAAAKRVKQAIAVGYRHIDTAQAYGNEAGVGAGIRDSGVPRETLFVTTKLAAEIKDYGEAVAAIEGSLEKMNIDYIDMMIIHSPKPWAEFQGDKHYFAGNLSAWKALEEAYQAGKLRAIGVSNFEKEDLQNIISHGTVKPMVNQVLAHIGEIPTELIRYTTEKGILTEAYSPIAHGEMLKDQTITKMATKYQVSIPQLAIRFLLQLGLLPLPKTENSEHMKNNAAVDFDISATDMETLLKVGKIDYGAYRSFPVFSKGFNN